MSELRALQAEVQRILGPLAHPRIGAMLALSEEVGELSKLVLEREVYAQPPQEEALKGELCDVLVCALELANLYGIDLQDALLTKLRDLEGRAPRWAEELGPALADARRRMDSALE